jgi:hypothetical protein
MQSAAKALIDGTQPFSDMTAREAINRFMAPLADASNAATGLLDDALSHMINNMSGEWLYNGTVNDQPTPISDLGGGDYRP